tara:strand:+ start:201 stop:437 length:237 start_codon:yes stop_codon:yes gene_type:complete
MEEIMKVTSMQHKYADSTVLRTRTCRYVLSLATKCIELLEHGSSTTEFKKIKSEIDYIKRMLKQEFIRSPSTRSDKYN